MNVYGCAGSPMRGTMVGYGNGGNICLAQPSQFVKASYELAFKNSYHVIDSVCMRGDHLIIIQEFLCTHMKVNEVSSREEFPLT